MRNKQLGILSVAEPDADSQPEITVSDANMVVPTPVNQHKPNIQNNLEEIVEE